MTALAMQTESTTASETGPICGTKICPFCGDRYADFSPTRNRKTCRKHECELKHRTVSTKAWRAKRGYSQKVRLGVLADPFYAQASTTHVLTIGEVLQYRMEAAELEQRLQHGALASARG